MPKLLGLDTKNWNKWLEDAETLLKERGYRKYKQNWKSETFAYWKSFYPWAGEEPDYQVGVLFFDWRDYTNDFILERVGIQFECMTLGEGRMDLSVCKDLTIEEFEVMSAEFYRCMGKWNSKQ